MSDNNVRDDIAFIRRAMEEGRAYARLRSPEFAVWGLAIALGYFGTYARVMHLWSLDPRFIWWVPVGLAWIFTLRDAIPAWLGQKARAVETPSLMVRSLRALWLGYGITATTLAFVAFSMTPHPDWFDAVAAGMLGLCFFVSAAIGDLPWLRWLALCWWAASVVLLRMEGPETLLVGGMFMLAFLFLPGLVLWLRRPSAHG